MIASHLFVIHSDKNQAMRRIFDTTERWGVEVRVAW